MLQELSSVKTDHDLMVTAESIIVAQERKQGLDMEKLRQIKITAARERLRVSVLNGIEVLQSETRLARASLSSGCPGIDQLLESKGFGAREITEFAGPSSTGKTQLALFSILTSLCLAPGSTALYIDASSSFSMARLEQLYLNSDRFEAFRAQGMRFESISERLHVSECYDPFSLLDSLNGLQHVLFEKAINHAVQSRPEDTGHSTTSTGLMSAKSHKPALGATWATVPSQTLFFTDTRAFHNVARESEMWEFQNRTGEAVNVVRRRVEVLKSAGSVVSRACLFFNRSIT
ncbi:hypothetical protein BC830DRAFT_1173746 [Chytriomyces sp. MP71]|nr:hypothetical protein BC830DRAFT_1173746 [Chytriomyces sp. MP71]